MTTARRLGTTAAAALILVLASVGAGGGELRAASTGPEASMLIGSAGLASEGFVVTGKYGPLRKGELKRATLWGRELRRSLSSTP